LGSSHVASKHRKGLIRPFKGLKGLIRPFIKGLIRPLGPQDCKTAAAVLQFHRDLWNAFILILKGPYEALKWHYKALKGPYKALLRALRPLKGLIRPLRAL